MPRAVSQAYYIKKFDRAAHQTDQDASVMAERQKRLDVHFTGVAYSKQYRQVWVGLTSYKGDLLWSFDPRTKKFKSHGFEPLAEQHEIKIHRGMQVGPDGLVYFGTASLVNTAQYNDAAGGRIFRYDPRKEAFEFLGRPVEHEYIQNIDVDHERGIIYGGTFPGGYVFGWDMEKRKTILAAWVGHWPHQVCVDDRGNCWAAYRASHKDFQVNLMYFSPRTGKITWTDVKIPGPSPKTGSRLDSFVNGGDGFLYFGSEDGALVRLDPRKVAIQFLCHPGVGSGLSALAHPVDGKLYGIAGRDQDTQVFSYDIKADRLTTYGPAWDADKDTYNMRPHELTVGPGGLLYCPETDNFNRQCYFWETKLRS